MVDIFPEIVIKLIISFINKDLVKKQPEQNTPSNVNAPLFNVSQSNQFRPLHHRIDPIYELFFFETHEKEGNIATTRLYHILLHTCIDAQLCNGLATMVAAVLCCPDQSTHLWYHIFSPDELLGKQVTGFLVRSRHVILNIKSIKLNSWILRLLKVDSMIVVFY